MEVIRGRRVDSKLTKIKLTLDYLDCELGIRGTLIDDGFPMGDHVAYENNRHNIAVHEVIRTFVILNHRNESLLRVILGTIQF